MIYIEISLFFEEGQWTGFSDQSDSVHIKNEIMEAKQSIVLPGFQRMRRKVIIHGSPIETSRLIHPHKVPSTISYIVPPQYSSNVVTMDNANKKFGGKKLCLPWSQKKTSPFSESGFHPWVLLFSSIHSEEVTGFQHSASLIVCS